MLKIGLLSDTHHFLDENIFRHFEACDEIWHAGDFGRSTWPGVCRTSGRYGVFTAISMERISAAPILKDFIGLRKT